MSFPSPGLLRVFLVVAALLTASASQLPATTTEPSGIYVVKIAGIEEGGSQQRTYLGPQLLTDTRLPGTVDMVTGNSFTLVGQDPPQFGDAETFYLQVEAGAEPGFITDIVEFGPDAFVCGTDLEDWLIPGDAIRIRAHRTIAGLFGDNEMGLQAGTSPETSDNIVMWDAALQQEQVYYYNSTHSRWENTAGDEAGNALVRFPLGLYVIRRSPGTLRLVLQGEPSGVPILLPVSSGANVFTLPINLSATLDNLVASDGPFAAIAGPNASSSDLLTMIEPSTGARRGPFYLSSRPGAKGWREVGVNGSDDAIQPLDLLSTLVLRRDGPPGFLRVHGDLTPGSHPPLPPDPDPGEVPLTGTLKIPPLPENLALMVQTSTDLADWSNYATPVREGNLVTFDLPSGQGRAFYRLEITPLP